MNLHEAEGACVREAIKLSNGVKAKAIEILGCSPRQIYVLLKRHGFGHLIDTSLAKRFAAHCPECGGAIPRTHGSRPRLYDTDRCRLRAADRKRRERVKKILEEHRRGKQA